MNGLLHLVQRELAWADCSLSSQLSPLHAVPNVTAHPSIASVRTIFILFDVAPALHSIGLIVLTGVLVCC